MGECKQGARLDSIFTIGHSNRPLEAFLDLLRENGVRNLVDVRRVPASRRHPQFGQERLARALAEAGVTYRHEPALGGRREPSPDSPHTAWRDPAFRGYADHMQTAAFSAALRSLVVEARGVSSAVLCAEADPLDCHRQLLADALIAAGLSVVHIRGPGQAVPHALHPSARISPDGRVGYPAPREAEQAPLFPLGRGRSGTTGPRRRSASPRPRSRPRERSRKG
jgi:uncharacterized protein (DUF488 family)